MGKALRLYVIQVGATHLFVYVQTLHDEASEGMLEMYVKMGIVTVIRLQSFGNVTLNTCFETHSCRHNAQVMYRLQGVSAMYIGLLFGQKNRCGRQIFAHFCGQVYAFLAILFFR